MDQSTAALGRRLVTVEVADCPACLSAGSVRRGVCDICGARPAQAPAQAPSSLTGLVIAHLVDE
ncbi:MAG TPA: hypothetical protein VFA46_19090 [Actinomycetes bacterium]|nr:hypothetical protein [Actinomycetes bacterium]